MICAYKDVSGETLVRQYIFSNNLKAYIFEKTNSNLFYDCLKCDRWGKFNLECRSRA